MSLTTPSSSQPRAQIASSGPLTSCTTLGAEPSASQAASACSSAASSDGPRSTKAVWSSAAASAMPVSSPVPLPQVPRKMTPVRPVRACASSQVDSSPCATSSIVTSKPPSTSGSALVSVANSRSRSTRNCRLSKSVCTSLRSHACLARSVGPSSSGTARSSSVSRRFCSTEARCSRSFSPTLPLTVSTWSTSASSEPYSRTHFAAVFSPTLGMLGRLSLGSPRSAAKSGYCTGDRPYLDSTSSGVKRVRSETPLRG